jgi:hypothetical protein
MPNLLIWRILIGVLQGGALYVLNAPDHHIWLATDAYLLSPMMAVAIFVPPLAIVSLGRLAPARAGVWILVAAALCVGLMLYGVYRDPPVAGAVLTGPTMLAWPALPLLLFIAHTFVIAGDDDRRLVATYPTLFHTACKLVVQLGLAALFVAVFWAALWLGAALFELIKLDFLKSLLRQREFYFTAPAAAFAFGLHVADGSATIVRGATSLGLMVLSWLLPLMCLLGIGFLLGLCFTGLQPLWDTGHASAILLTAAVTIILLINAVYQDGHAYGASPALLRYSTVVAAATLVPLVVLAAYALMLRAQQYGFSQQRIIAAACIAVPILCAAGYVVAVLRTGVRLRGLEATNIASAVLAFALIVALATPIADPSRLAVADQLARLKAGRTTLAQFDFNFLRFRAGGFGIDALRAIAAAPADDPLHVAAVGATAALNRALPQPQPVKPLQEMTAEQRAGRIRVVYPAGAPLPESFLKQDWGSFEPRWRLPSCLYASDASPCFAILIDQSETASLDILVFSTQDVMSASFRSSNDKWIYEGALVNYKCEGVRAALQAGTFEMRSRKEIVAAGQSLYLTPSPCVSVD